MRVNIEGIRFENEEEETVYLDSARTRRGDLLLLFDAVAQLVSYVAPVAESRRAIRNELRDKLLRIEEK